MTYFQKRIKVTNEINFENGLFSWFMPIISQLLKTGYDSSKNCLQPTLWSNHYCL